MTDDPNRRTDDHTGDEEYVPEDDAIIGRVFRWSLLVVGVAIVVAFVGYELTREEALPEQILEKEVGGITEMERETEKLPAVAFTDVTRDAAIDFVHVSGAEGEKLLPETMGSGTAFFDYDGDGDQDLLLVNARWWPGKRGNRPRPTQRLYANDGAGRFEDVTKQTGLDLTLFGMGAAVGDYDNDGDADLFLTALGPDHLLRNDGGRFTDVTSKAGVSGGKTAWSSSAGFFDYDNDGDLDLFVCTYVKWSREIDYELNFSLNGRDRAYGPPTNYEGVHPTLYRNEGDGNFTDVSEESGVQVANPVTGGPMAKALALSFFDVDRDGYLDVFVANDTIQNFLFHNNGDGTFEEIGAVSGVGFDSTGKATGAMGIDAAHYRNDDDLAVSIANFANEMSSLYVSQDGGLIFTDEAMGEGIGSPSRVHLSFGLFFFDYDLDGRLDLLQSNGHLEDEINQVQASQHYRQPAQLFWNAGTSARSCFVEVPEDTLGDLRKPIVGRGAAYADIDADGDLDVVLTQTAGPPLLLRNDQAVGNHWIRLRLEGTSSNRDAIGAMVEAVVDGTTLRRHVMPTRSYVSQVELPVTIGLGDAEGVESLRILWPGGSEQAVDDVAIDALTVVRQQG